MPAKNTRILVAEDEPQALRLVTRSLEVGGFEVIGAKDGQQALEAVETGEPDLLLLDILLPGFNGFEVCERVRAFSGVPIIMLTARSQVQDKARAFDAGADDYITKPFSIVELLARVHAVLRRAQWGANGGLPSITVGQLTVDFPKHQVTIGGRVAALTPIEYRILAYLIQNAGRVVTYDLLLEHVWGVDYIGEGHLLKVNINRLRGKIEPDPAHPLYILTRTGLGYMMPAQVDLPDGGGNREGARQQRSQILTRESKIDQQVTN